MNEPLIWILALLAGALLGAFFFGGLWWTIRKGLASSAPALWFLGSLIVRTAVVLGGFFLVSAGSWQRMIACLLGFVIARFVIVQLRHESESRSESSKTSEP
jgi:F1F0 ATPase subunit 2